MAVRRTWFGLSEEERRAVRRYARRGQEHPDPEIAQAAKVWATETLHRDNRAEVAGSVLFGILVDGAFGGGWLGSLIGERRSAKKILMVSQGGSRPDGEDRGYGSAS
jgi:hypothetical protein